MKVTLNQSAIAKLNQAIEDAYAEVVSSLEFEFEAVINDPSEFADLGLVNQDIVDTGRFRDSQKVNTFEESSVKVSRFEWNPTDPVSGFQYAGAILTGFYAYGGTKYIPGRDWTKRAVQRVDPVAMFENELRIRV